MKTYKYTMNYIRGVFAGKVREATVQFASKEEFWKWVDYMNDKNFNFYVACGGEVTETERR